MIHNRSSKYLNNASGLSTQSISKGSRKRRANQLHSTNITTLPARNKRSVWTVPTRPFKGAHFATFPPDLIRTCIEAGCPPEGTVLDPFMGAGTTAVVAQGLGRNYIGVELNAEYVRLAEERVKKMYKLF